MVNNWISSFCLICIFIVMQSSCSSNPARQNLSQSASYAKAAQFQLAPPMIMNEAVFFENKNQVKLILELEGAQIHYTTDESEPTNASPIFQDRIILEKSATLKAKAFHSQYLPSETVTAQFIKLGAILPIQNISINRTPHQNYSGTGAEGLVDRKKGTTNFRTDRWMGFEGGELEAVFEFEQKIPVQKITVSLLSDQGSWIFLPRVIEIYTSDNGEDFKFLAGQNINPTEEGAPNELKFVKLRFPKTSTKYVKVLLKSHTSIPDWHPGKGTPPWLFIDEILVN